MAVKSKVQLVTDINADSDWTGTQKGLLGDVVDSYTNYFSPMNTIARDALIADAGLIIYNTDSNRYEYFNGDAWFGIGQDLSTPMTVKVDLSSADLLALGTVPKQLIAAPASGYAIAPTQVAIRYTYGSAGYAGTFTAAVIKSASKTTSDYYGAIVKSGVLNQTVNKSGLITLIDSSILDAIVEADALELKANGTVTTGDGTLTIWVTYSLINY